MNRSPLFLKALNRIIGRTMRRIQLETNDLVQFYLTLAMDCLNKARRVYKQGKNELAEWFLTHAKGWVESARKFKAKEAMYS